MLIDTHAHLNFFVYEESRKKVINRSLIENTWMINVGTNYQTSKKAVEILKEYKKGIFAAIGLHPINLDTGLLKMRKDKNEGGEDFCFEKDFDDKKYSELILKGQGKVVAIGEFGFDYWYRPKSRKKKEQFKERQRDLFKKEILLAEKFKLPLILHCRLGYDDLIRELENTNYKYGGVIHCFCGTLEQAKSFLKMGYYIGFNGIIFKLALDEIIKNTPLDKLLIETDCPFLTPPQLGEIRNEPINVKYVAEKIAKIKNIKPSKVVEITTKNAFRLFKLG